MAHDLIAAAFREAAGLHAADFRIVGHPLRAGRSASPPRRAEVWRAAAEDGGATRCGERRLRGA